MQETLIKPNLVYWTGLGLILGKALDSVHLQKRLAALSVDVTEMTDVCDDIKSTWGVSVTSSSVTIEMKYGKRQTSSMEEAGTKNNPFTFERCQMTTGLRPRNIPVPIVVHYIGLPNQVPHVSSHKYNR